MDNVHTQQICSAFVPKNGTLVGPQLKDALQRLFPQVKVAGEQQLAPFCWQPHRIHLPGIQQLSSERSRKTSAKIGNDSSWCFVFGSDGDMDAEDDLIGDWLFMGCVEDQMDQGPCPCPSTSLSKPSSENPWP